MSNINTASVDQEKLYERLRAEIRGEVLTDQVSLGLYATDASIYQILPLAVVLPRDRADVLKAMRIAGELGAPILPRGGGTSLSGQTIAWAVVIDVSKYMNRLLEVNAEEKWARVEPGLVRDELNALLVPYGLQFCPDPATSNRANVGGMVANNTGGMRSIRYGTTIDHIVELDLALATGEVLNLGTLAEEAYAAKCALRDREGEIYRGFRQLIEQNREEIEARFPKVPRRSGGYPLDAFAAPLPWNMAKIVSGSEGTLGMVLEVKVRLEPLPRHTGLCVAHFATMSETLRAVAPIVDHRPSAVELLDKVVVDLARESLLTRTICGFIEGYPAAVLIIEAMGDTPAEVEAALKETVEDLRARGLGYAYPIMTDEVGQKNVWLMRKNGLGLMTTIKGERKPTPFIEDAAVPLEVLPDYIESVLAICAKHGRVVSIYAHASVGLIHVRPMLDLHLRSELDDMKAIAQEVHSLVKMHKGSLSGEHGDGIVRSGFNEWFFGSQLYGAFHQVKQLFDPRGLMNPGKVIDSPPMDENLRFMPGYKVQFTETMFHYREDNGFRHAVEQCTGVGACRKTLGGTMCPSYIATREEEHSTRGRANALRLAMTGQLGPEGMSSERLREVLELCLSCKGCKNECPNNVDMSRLRAEAMHQYHLKHGSTLRERLFRDFPKTARLASGALAPLANGVMRSGPVKAALDRFVGIDKRRTMPAYANEPLSVWFKRRGAVTGGSGGKTKTRVALFNDTYIEHNEPWVGRAAVEVLEAAGYAVELISAGCCQRPALSKGFLEEAKRGGTETFRRLDPLASQGIPILVCEPSCASSLMDDLPDLIDDESLGRRVSKQIKMIDQFLAEELKAGRCKLPWRTGGGKDSAATAAASTSSRTIYLHGHCHQKAFNGTTATKYLLSTIPGVSVKDIDAGCCGMAGSFGYEKEHYELSMKVGEDRLFPALRAAGKDSLVVACGFSCRHQIADGVQMKARHVIELVREAI